MTGTIRLLVPTATSAPELIVRAARPPMIRTLAFLHNGQPQYDALAGDLVEVLEGRPGLTVRQYRKPRYGSPAAATILDEMARAGDAALVGLAC